MPIGLKRMWAGLLISAAVLTLASGTAAAHAELLSTNPSADSVVEVAPAEIVLTFTEAVNSVSDSIRVVTSDGDEIDIDDVRQDQGNETMAAGLPSLADGSYVVAWRAVSVDSHPISGAFVFSVGAATATDAGLVESLLADAKPSNGSERWLGLGRGASYLGIAGLVGITAVLSLLAPDLLLGRRAGRVLIGSIVVGAIGTALMIAAQASVAVGDWTKYGEVYDSSAGRWWFIRLALVLLAVVPVMFRRELSSATWWPAAMSIGGGGLLAVVAEGGHGVTGPHRVLGFVATVVHLAAMSIWFGGLASILLVAPRRRIGSLAAAFSPMALATVVVLATTGVYNSWRQVGSWSGLTDSTYGTWLIIKLTILAAVLAAATTSRWLLHSTTPPAPAVPSDDLAFDGPNSPVDGATTSQLPPRASAALGRTVLVEVLGIVLVFAATAGLVNSAPPRAAALPPVASATTVVDGRIAQITLDPPVSGGTTMHIYLTNSTGSLDQPTDIAVTATLLAQNIGPLSIATVVAGPGHVTATDANLPIAGSWTFTITAKYGEFDQEVFTAELAVR